MDMNDYPNDDDSYNAGVFVGAVLGVLGTVTVCALILAVVVWAL